MPPKIHLQGLFTLKLSFLHFRSNQLNGVTSTHWLRWRLCYKFLCSIFSKGTEPFDYTKSNIIWKLTFNIKYINQINGGLILFFKNSRIFFFNWLVWLWTIWKVSIFKTGKQSNKIVQCSLCSDYFHII